MASQQAHLFRALMGVLVIHGVVATRRLIMTLVLILCLSLPAVLVVQVIILSFMLGIAPLLIRLVIIMIGILGGAVIRLIAPSQHSKLGLILILQIISVLTMNLIRRYLLPRKQIG